MSRSRLGLGPEGLVYIPAKLQRTDHLQVAMSLIKLDLEFIIFEVSKILVTEKMWRFLICESNMSKKWRMKANMIIFLSTIAIIISPGVKAISMGGEIFKAFKSDSFGDMVCSLKDANEILYVQSKTDCILQCQGDPSCSDVNWKEPDKCEVYFFKPGTFGTVTSCTYFSSGRGKLYKFNILFMLRV